MYPVTLVGPAGYDLVQEDHRISFFGHRHAAVAHAWQAGGQLGQFVVVGGE